MIALLDTDVLVDCLRDTAPSQAWMAVARNETFEVPGVAAMELVAGCQNQADLRQCRKFLASYSIAWPQASEFARAYELLAEHRLGSAIGIPDCIIAAMALERSCRLYSFNLKHFRVVQGLDVRAPFDRTAQQES